MLEELQVATAAQLAGSEAELRFWLKELDPDADRRITKREFESALSRYAVAVRYCQGARHMSLALLLRDMPMHCWLAAAGLPLALGL